MRIAQVIGRVTLARKHPAFASPRFVLVRPLSAQELADGSSATAEELVAYDDLGSGVGARIGLSEGREAANPFGKTKTPVDAYCACLFDRIDIIVTETPR